MAPETRLRQHWKTVLEPLGILSFDDIVLATEYSAGEMYFEHFMRQCLECIDQEPDDPASQLHVIRTMLKKKHHLDLDNEDEVREALAFMKRS